MSSVEDSINRIMDKTRFRTFPKVRAAVKRDHPDITDKELRDIISRRNHVIRPGRVRNKIYQVKIFSRSRNSWLGDLYDNLDGHEPRYWHIFINTNTRYAVAYELPDKTKNSIHHVLVRFVNEYHPRKLTHDEEKAWSLISKWITSKIISVFCSSSRNSYIQRLVSSIDS